MFTRRLLTAAACAAALATLTSCKGADTDASPEATASSAPAASSPAATPSGSPAPSAPASASASPVKDLPIDPEPTSDCTPGKLAKGPRMMQVMAAPSHGALSVREAKFACDPNGGGYAGTGKAARRSLAPGATAELSTGATGHRTVTVAELTRHLSACLRHDQVEPPLACSGDIYEVTVNGSGAVSHLREIWHS
ncbi:hypothetical protein [Streptomyces decoyicus]|uniref:hypothetical protein n=1 Tax=Streptomyces decoyicus TaxID=249567 RepID=UPI000AABD86E|nr:hypothetical protein [Streptomyces decoyicus]QZY15925.1 hypothetical protein K7C20_12195 [Streptomyces decoyicus]